MAEKSRPSIVWFREDLRLADNPALHAGVARGEPVVCVYVLETDRIRPRGSASRWWLHHSLASLDSDLAKRGGSLILRRGSAATAIPALVREVDAAAVYWTRRYGDAAEADGATAEALSTAGIEWESFNAKLLREPWEVETKSGGAFKVFTAYWRAASAGPETAYPLPAPRGIQSLPTPPRSDDLASWALLPARPDWAAGIEHTWTPGEAGAHARLADFLEDRLEEYDLRRDFPASEVTSRLSPHLAFGEIGPRQIFAALAAARHPGSDAARKFRSEIGWREFSYHLLAQEPDLAGTNFNKAFDDFGWRESPADLRAWQRGRTGYPIVDAAMRQLWQTGWMHNRLRLIVGSFLVKDLLVDWRAGEEWFWDTLVDADPANNPANWQWVAGTGADAAPYFRVFNPVLQSKKFDPDGAFIRRFVPELDRLTAPHIHEPWTAPGAILAAANVTLGETYPHPIVDHRAARDRALAAYGASR
jgi:deoxyribodipyrimidine photo-lyase